MEFFLLICILISDWTKQGISFTLEGLRNILRHSIPLILGATPRQIQRQTIVEAAIAMTKISEELGREDAFGLLYGLIGTDIKERDSAIDTIFSFTENAEKNVGKKAHFKETLLSCLTLYYAYCLIVLNREEFQFDAALVVGDTSFDIFQTEEDLSLEELRAQFSPSKKIKE